MINGISEKRGKMSLDALSYVGIIIFITVNLMLALMGGVIFTQFYRIYEIVRGIP